MDEELPEFAIIIEKLNQELEEERTKYENKITIYHGLLHWPLDHSN